MTWYRHPVVTARHTARTEQISRHVRGGLETVLAELPGDSGRGHLLMNLPPEAAVSAAASSRTSAPTRQEFPDLARHYRPRHYRPRHYWPANRRWSEGRRTSGHFGS